jgi:RNA polymerase-binding transcription factor DksA
MEKRKPTRGRRLAKAATRDVLGATPIAVEVPAKWRKYYKRLAELRASVQHRQGELVKDALEETPNYSLHIADAGTDTYDRDFALGMLSSEQNAVYEIDEALDRIRNGSYGVCELTGRKIEPQRLEAIPWTRFSAEAERQLEKEGGVPRARLGEREAVPRVQAAEESEETE